MSEQPTTHDHHVPDEQEMPPHAEALTSLAATEPVTLAEVDLPVIEEGPGYDPSEHTVDTDDDPDVDVHVAAVDELREADAGEPVEVTRAAGVPTVNGFSVERYGSPRIGRFTVPGAAVAVNLRREVAPLILAFARDFHRLVEPLHEGWCWGHAYRAVTGGSSWSFHAPGIAVDYNAPRHPLGKRGTFTRQQAATIRALARKYGMRWGGDYQYRADEMHVEIIVDRQAALRLVEALQKPAEPAPTPPEPSPSWGPWSNARPGQRTLSRWDRGDDVAFVQRWLGLPDDGYYGPDTVAAVQRYQRQHRLDPDGVVGRDTWKVMLDRDEPARAPEPPPFPGRRAFRLWRKHPAVVQWDRVLITLGHTKHHSGDGYQPGPRFTRATRRNTRDFQRSIPELRGDADGYPGPLTWRLGHERAAARATRR